MVNRALFRAVLAPTTLGKTAESRVGKAAGMLNCLVHVETANPSEGDVADDLAHGLAGFLKWMLMTSHLG